MKIKNTSYFTTEQIRAIIEFVRPSGIANFDVMAKKSSHAFAGRAYYRGSGFHSSASPFVVLRIGGDSHFPYRLGNENKRKGGYLDMGYIYNKTEAMVVLAAHELRHLWQDKVKKGRRVWGARGQYSERDADAYALGKLRAWRREHGVSR